ncbi:uncharacterized protein BCR38DRAFT_347958, partial [Pseudomassariella vexata]
AAPTFCKCTCFTNSTIIRLGPQDSSSSSSPSSALSKRAASASCTQCNRAFCIQNQLPICKDAAEKDILTMCFQRDSRKDQIIVWGFLLGTAGLLGWAAVKRVVEMRDEKQNMGVAGMGLPSPGRAPAGNRGTYVPVGEGER